MSKFKRTEPLPGCTLDMEQFKTEFGTLDNLAEAIARDRSYKPMQEPTPRTFNDGVPRQFTLGTDGNVMPERSPLDARGVPNSLAHIASNALRAVGMLPEPPRARNTDPDTSHEAAHAVAPHAEKLRIGILATLRYHQARGLTTHEIADAADLEWGSITPRMLPLETDGLVIRDGKRVSTGRRAKSIIWKITTAGVRYLHENSTPPG